MSESIMYERIKIFVKRETVFVVSFLLAVFSAVFVRPGREYIGYIDFRTLALLFCLMAVVAGLQSIGAFSELGNILLKRVRDTRQLFLVLILLCFFSSMLITNDVALITFVPFSIFVCRAVKQEERLIRLIVLETIAANLGSMATPVGNPQNLYLYSVSGISSGAFFRAVLPYAGVAFILLFAAAFWEKKTPLSGQGIQESGGQDISWHSPRLYVYLGLFLLCIMVVIHLIPWPVALAAVLCWLCLKDRQLAGHVDYWLLFTFICFFIFIGNMKRIDAVSVLLRQMIEGHELLMGVLVSQVISNVPAAILLSGFTGNYGVILTAVDLGGLGTLIASLASLISFKFFVKDYGQKKGKYLAEFTVWNVGFLLILFAVALFLT